MEVWSQLTQENSAATLGVCGDNSGTRFQNMARGGGVVVLAGQSGKHSVNQPVYPEPGRPRITKYDAYVPYSSGSS